MGRSYHIKVFAKPYCYKKSEYISAYKNHEKCPVLVEKGYEDQVAEFVEVFNHNSLIKATFDLAEKGGCPGKLILMNCAACGETKEVCDFEISCPVDLNDQSNVQVYTDDDGLRHYLQKVTCPECGIRLKIDLWEDTGKNSHQITRVYDRDGALLLEVTESCI